MALNTIDVHGEILAPITNTPAVGTVTFRIVNELRDTVTNIVYAPATFTATLDVNGEFTITLPVTDNPDITPLDWAYWVYVDTDVWNPDPYYVQLPAALGPVAEFADLIPITTDPCTPDGTACAPLSILGEIAELTELVDAVQDEVDAVELTVIALTASLGDLASDVSTNTGDIATLNVTTGAIVGQLNVLSPIVLDNQAAIAILQGQINNIDAAWITSGTLDYRRLGGIIAENLSVIFGRATLVDPGTAADMWQWEYNGTRVTYINEYGALRVRGVDEVQTPARFMSHFNRDNTTLPTFQVSLSNGTTHWFEVLANGTINANGLSMLPTAALGVTFNAAGAGNAALINDGNVANTGAPYPVTTTLEAANRRVHLDGSMANNSGVAIGAQTTLFTVDAAHRPTAWTQFTVRTSTNLACRVTVKGATGAVCLDQSLAAAATVSFDGANWRKS